MKLFVKGRQHIELWSLEVGDQDRATFEACLEAGILDDVSRHLRLRRCRCDGDCTRMVAELSGYV